MQFDKEEHKQIVMTLIEKAQFPGAIIEQVAELKAAIASSKVVAPWVPEHTPKA